MIRLFLLNPDTKFAARVNQASFTYPIAECEFDGITTGAFGDLLEGMTILFGTTIGADDLGRQRIRKAADADTIFFGRSSQGAHDGEVNLQDNAYITVLWDYRVWAKIPYSDYIDAESPIFYKDGDIAVGTFTDDVPPVSNAGVGIAGTINSGTSKLQVTLPHEANTSFALSGTISSYLWSLPSGVTLDSGLTSDSQITVNCDPGFYWVRLTVTDSNGKTHESRVPIFARDPASDDSINAFIIESHKIKKDGQELSIRIREAIAESTYPDGTLVMLWEDEPSGPTDRSHMIFIGWHQDDPTNIEAKRTGILTDTTFQYVDVVGRMRALPGFPQSIGSNDSPTTWEQMSSPSMDKYLHYLMYWHSSALELADWSNSGVGSSYPFVILESVGDSIWSQVEQQAKAMVPDYILGCNTLGQLVENVDPIVQATGSRTATVQTTLTEADWSSIRYDHRRPPRVHWHRGNAILAHADNIDSIFCIAPGDTPGQGEISQEQGHQLAQSQLDLNVTEGHRYARLNAEETHFKIMLAEGADKDIEPADLTWVRLDIGAAYAAQRGLTFSNERGLVHEINIKYNHARGGLTRAVELLWERETDGPPAVTFTMPDPPPWDDTIDDWPDDETDYEPKLEGDGFGTVYVMQGTGWGRTRDFSLSSPLWEDISGNLSGYTCVYFILDPWAPGSIGYAMTSGGATPGVYKSTNLNTDAPTWSLLISAVTIQSIITDGGYVDEWGNIAASINIQDYFIFSFRTSMGAGNDGNVWCGYTFNGGDSWTLKQISATTMFAWNKPMIAVVPHTIGGSLKIYCAMSHSNHGTLGDMHLWVSDDAGVTWTSKNRDFTSNVAAVYSIDAPYGGNEAGDICYITADANNLWKTENGGQDFIDDPKDDVSQDYGDDVISSVMYQGGVSAFTQDGDRIMMWDTAAPGAGGSGNLRISTIGGDDGSFSTATQTGRNGTDAVRGAGGFPYDNSQFYMFSNEKIYVSIDAGENWIDKTGNYETAVGSLGSIGIIVPNWLE